MSGWLWPRASATGVGPVAGTDPLDAAKLVLDELPSFPHLPELPERGAGADPTGRTAALLVDLHVELAVGRWRLVPRPTTEGRAARELLARDVDALELVARAYEGPLKVQLLGPWTLARRLELPAGERVLADPSAVGDVAASLAEGLAAHVAELRHRLPGISTVLVELEETALAPVLAGAVPTASGWARYPVVERQVAEEVEGAVIAAASGAGGAAGARLAGVDAPVEVVRRAGARFLALAASDLRPEIEEHLGEAVEAGVGLLAGLVPPGDDGRAGLDELAGPARRLWSRLGLSPALLPEAVVVTPGAGLVGLPPDAAATLLRRGVDLARWLEEEYRAGG